MKKKFGFTLAEVLITLSIIGVIAALVIPSLMMNYQYRAVGTKLSKFMSTLENTTRAYVVSNEGLGTDLETINRYINSVFSYTGSGTGNLNLLNDDNKVELGNGSGAIKEPWNYHAQIDGLGDYKIMETMFKCGPKPKKSADNAARLYLKDGTNVMFSTITAGRDETDNSKIWYNHPNPGITEVGKPVLGILLDPQATGLPATVHRVFAFVVTELGYVFPHPVDDCTWDIMNDNFVTNADTFAKTKTCGQKDKLNDYKAD